ncbi:MAG: protein-glutamate O-methyltransferase CheR [Deltaproteobacteria bacterium]|nr:protein-glutamate O-methyltransferase CheR [Deltaproteobacteria bacterium]
MYKINTDEYKVLSKYIMDISGILLEEGKEYLIETRLTPLLDELGCKSFSELYYKARMDNTKSVEKKIIDNISTNETYFFRDKAPFELIQHKIIPDLIDSRSQNTRPGESIKIRIWSAASSTGQEIYSIIIMLKELYLDPQKYEIQLLGTDISNSAIVRASYGKYNKFEIARGLPPEKVRKYFIPDGDGWKIKDELRSMATFKKINLMDSLAGMGKFDIVLCRNVAIYFAPEERSRLYRKIASTMEKDGYLIIGATESLTNDTNLFEPQKYLRSVFYQLK